MLGSIQAWLAAAGAFVLLLAAAVFKGWSARGAAEKSKAQEKQVEDLREIRETENEVEKLSDDDLARELSGDRRVR